MTFMTTFPSPLGEILLASDGEALTGLWLEGQRNYGSTLGEAPEKKEEPVLKRARRWLEAYFAGVALPEPPPLKLIGTRFQLAVWEEVSKIPYGETTSYASISKDLGMKGILASPQAVGSALGRNPILLLVPCHRVVGADGDPRGYAAGTDRQRFLLQLERGAV